MKKNYPKILAVTLLVILALLTILASTDILSNLTGDKSATSEDAEATSQNENSTDTAPQEPSNVNNSSEAIEDLLADLQNDWQESNESNEVVIKADFEPIPPRTESSLFIWEQTLCSENEEYEIKNIHCTNYGIYVAIETKLSNKMVLFRIKEDGTVDKKLDNFVSEDTSYLASEMTSEGLILVGNSETKTYIVTVDIKDCNIVNTLILNKMNEAVTYAINDYLMLIAKGENCTAYAIKNSAILNQTELGSGSVADVFGFEKSKSVFMNTEDGYKVITIAEKGLNCVAENFIPQKKLLKVIPITENGMQKYIALEIMDGTIYITKYDSSFNQKSAQTISLGLAEDATAYVGSDSLLVLLKNSSTRIYLSDLELNFKLSTSEIFKNIGKIYMCENTADGFVLLMQDCENNIISFLNVKDDGAHTKNSLPCYGTEAMFSVTSDGNAVVFYENNGKIAIFKTEI